MNRENTCSHEEAFLVVSDPCDRAVEEVRLVMIETAHLLLSTSRSLATYLEVLPVPTEALVKAETPPTVAYAMQNAIDHTCVDFSGIGKLARCCPGDAAEFGGAVREVGLD